MAFIPVNDTARIDFIYNVDAEVCVNTLHVFKSGGFGAEEMSVLADTARDAWVARLSAQHSTAVGLSAVRATDLDSENSPSYELSVAPIVYGQVVGECCPLNVSLSYTMTTGYRGRSRRGRWYWVGLPITLVGTNHADTAYVSSTITAFGDLFADLIAAGYQPVVVSRYANNQPRTTGITTPIDGVRCDAKLDSQRRRLSGRGR